MNEQAKAETDRLEKCCHKLHEAAKRAMYHFTGETEVEWRRSQAYSEAPYHFLYEAIIDAER